MLRVFLGGEELFDHRLVGVWTDDSDSEARGIEDFACDGKDVIGGDGAEAFVDDFGVHYFSLGEDGAAEAGVLTGAAFERHAVRTDGVFLGSAEFG